MARLITLSVKFTSYAMLGWALSCSRSRLHTPRLAPRSAEDPSSVAMHPPPAALPEVVSRRPSSTAQWLHGVWIWERNSWIWQRGGWIENPDDARLIQSDVEYTKDGVLLYFPRRWMSASGSEVTQPDIVEPAGTPPTPRLAEEDTVP